MEEPALPSTVYLEALVVVLLVDLLLIAPRELRRAVRNLMEAQGLVKDRVPWEGQLEAEAELGVLDTLVEGVGQMEVAVGGDPPM